MRLYLSSFRMGSCPERLPLLAKGKRRAAVIANACDAYPTHGRAEGVNRELTDLEALGFDPFEIDLRRFFSVLEASKDLSSTLDGCGLVWVRGGNSFVLRRAMSLSGFDFAIRERLREDAIVYGGYSAGIDMLSKSLHGTELVDDPNLVPAAYGPEIVWEGLDLLPYKVAPHYRSPHPESADVDRLVQYCIDNHLLFRAIRDGEVIIIDGCKEEVITLADKRLK